MAQKSEQSLRRPWRKMSPSEHAEWRRRAASILDEGASEERVNELARRLYETPTYLDRS